jgi:cytidylate kinase
LKLKNNIRLLLTCDSGAAAGKTTASKYLSKHLGLVFLPADFFIDLLLISFLSRKKTTSDVLFLKKNYKKY